MRCSIVLIAVIIVEACAQAGGDEGLGQPVEIDSESGAEIYLLGADERPADNIYGEQPYGDASGRRITIRYYSTHYTPGGITIYDLQDGSRHGAGATGDVQHPVSGVNI